VGGDLASYMASLLAAVRRQDEDAIQVYDSVGAPGRHDTARHTVARHGHGNVLWYLVEEAKRVVATLLLVLGIQTVRRGWCQYGMQSLAL
jgi:hypothetical protein